MVGLAHGAPGICILKKALHTLPNERPEVAATGLDSSQDLAIHISRRKWIFVGPYKRGPRPDSDIQSKRNKRNTVIQMKKNS